MKLAIFILLSIILLVFTLVRPYRHRYYRFLAFESLLILVILNSESWFHNPFSLIQFISWIFLLCSLLLAINGFRILKIAGSPNKDIEDTTEIVTTGVYRYIRHPLYFSLLLGGVGAFLKDPDITGLFLLISLFIFLYLTARVEEKDNLYKFGSAYHNYMEKTKMFIPFLF
jgi:protein-S-isoprenylcysteine O-methyltransferase Ste14